jgi:predicted DCC family thiol-disulfide oxidoreductase YuxK
MIPDEGTTNTQLERPLLLFDGDCGFCRFWVERWKSRTRGRVDFAPAQQEAARFPQVTEQAWKRAVQLVPDGTVCAGAEAVLAALACMPKHRWMLGAYRRVPGARPASNPFPDRPPRYVRAVSYDYHFTDFAARRATGDWWRRERAGLYFPAVSLRGQ